MAARAGSVLGFMRFLIGDFRFNAVMLVMLVEADIDDVVPTRSVMALEALVDARVLFAGNLLRNHRKVPHEVARRRLMALHALLGPG